MYGGRGGGGGEACRRRSTSCTDSRYPFVHASLERSSVCLPHSFRSHTHSLHSHTTRFGHAHHCTHTHTPTPHIHRRNRPLVNVLCRDRLPDTCERGARSLGVKCKDLWCCTRCRSSSSSSGSSNDDDVTATANAEDGSAPADGSGEGLLGAEAAGAGKDAAAEEEGRAGTFRRGDSRGCVARQSPCCRSCLEKVFPMPQWVGVLVALVVVIALLACLVAIIVASVATLQGPKFIAYEAQFNLLTNKTAAFMTDNFKIDGAIFVSDLKKMVPIGKTLALLVDFSVQFLSQVLLVLVFVIFLLVEKNVTAQESNTASLRFRMDEAITTYISVKAQVSFFAAVCVLVIYLAFQLPLAFMFGLLTFFLHFIPNVGPLLAVILPVPILLLDVTIPTASAACILVIPTVIHLLVGNVIEPIMYETGLHMHPVVVLFALGFWYVLWGVIGAFVAVPLTAIIIVVVKNIDHTMYPWAYDLDRILSGKFIPDEESNDATTQRGTGGGGGGGGGSGRAAGGDEGADGAEAKAGAADDGGDVDTKKHS